jgi:hypothetical protein
MISVQQDIQYLEASLASLEDYLHSKELYYPVGLHLPQLTLGGVLLSLRRLYGSAEGSRYEIQIEAIRTEWRSAWDAKADREVRARSELWRNYLSEYRSDPRGSARLYPQQVRYRAMITMLGSESDAQDEYLRSIFLPGAFVWEAEIQAAFAPQSFWYLYGSIKI